MGGKEREEEEKANLKSRDSFLFSLSLLFCLVWTDQEKREENREKEKKQEARWHFSHSLSPDLKTSQPDINQQHRQN